ncbi:MAG TPA: hypothetical protein VLS46_01905, partial [Gaiellaceae bacterium]|nr:hypothetical protein [Gaiellaceae bacterium]
MLAGGTIALAVIALPSLGAAAPPTAPAAAARGGAAAATSPDQAALEWVAANRRTYGLSPAQLRNLEVTRSYRSTHNGAAHVRIGQRIDGAEVEGSGLTFLFDRTGSLVSVQGTLASGHPSGQAKLGPSEALARSAQLSGRSLGVPPRELARRGDKHVFV